MNEELMNKDEREIEHCIVMAQGYWTQASRLLGEKYGNAAERRVREFLLSGTLIHEDFYSRVQTRLNKEATNAA